MDLKKKETLFTDKFSKNISRYLFLKRSNFYSCIHSAALHHIRIALITIKRRIKEKRNEKITFIFLYLIFFFNAKFKLYLLDRFYI